MPMEKVHDQSVVDSPVSSQEQRYEMSTKEVKAFVINEMKSLMPQDCVQGKAILVESCPVISKWSWTNGRAVV